MKKLFSQNVILNDTHTILNFVESPKSGNLSLPKNSLGYYVGADGQLYKPVITFGKTYMDKETLRDFVWHAIRNTPIPERSVSREVTIVVISIFRF